MERQHRKIIIVVVIALVITLFLIAGVKPFAIGKDLAEFATSKQETEQNKTITFDDFLTNLPEANEEGYVVINDDVPFFSEEEKAISETFETYSELDSLGRCGSAMALVSKQATMPENNERTDISKIKPSGWKTLNTKNTFDCVLADGTFYFYNRCHLLANCLCANEEYKAINNSKVNLITGTRQMNLLMKEYEESIAKYCETTGKSVLVRATPIFVDDEPLARGVLYEGYTVNNDDKGLKFCVYFFNTQKDFEINYSTSWVDYVPKS